MESEQLVCLLCGRVACDPRLLSCLHSFCSACLQKKAKGKIICCPTCQEETRVPASGVSALPTDFLAVNFLAFERLRQGEQVMLCDTCGGDDEADEATHRCTDCQVFLCDLHSKGHRKARKTSGHVLQPAAELRLKVNVPTALDFAIVRRALTCNVSGHEEKQLELFCATCDKLVCRDCILVEHREHKYSFVRDAGKGQRQAIAGRLKAVRDMSARMGKVNKSVQRAQCDLSTCVDKLTQEIRQTVEMHKQRLEQREKVLLDCVDELCGPKASILEDQSARLTRLEKSLDDCAGMASRVLEYGCDEEVILLKAWLVHRMTSLAKSGEEEANFPLDDGLLTFDFSEDCLCAINGLGAVQTRPFARKSEILAPASIVVGQSLQLTAVLRNSLGVLSPLTGSSQPSLEDLKIVVKQSAGRGKPLPSTSRFTFRPGKGECLITTHLQNARKGELEVTATLYQQHLDGSPVIIRTAHPPWTFNPQYTCPPSNMTDHIVKLSDTKLTLVVTKQSDQESQRQWENGQHCYIHIFGDSVVKKLKAQNPHVWRIHFTEIVENSEGAHTEAPTAPGDHLWSVGIMQENYAQNYLRSGDDHYGWYRNFLSSNNLSGYYHIQIIRGKFASESSSTRDYEESEECLYGRGRGYTDSSLEWSPGDVLELQLTESTLTVTNLSSKVKATVQGFQFPCRPVIGVPIVGMGSEIMLDFPS